MRTPMPAANLCLTVALCLALAACRGPQQPDATVPPASGPATEATVDEADAATGDAGLEGDIIASTNEPFWQAQVSGPVLVLRGIDGQRELAVTTSDTAGDTRSVRATDASGLVELTVTATECQDTMSGATFPYSAVLSIDGGGPINGCARPASMPPPGEPQ
ncbi:hypothetical protein [Pseudoxanthomonas suwonensis]|uniref:hypothetical protein n=1 Tax=Pseudoxanthomonas suwonensis TaxID=314722 RepID=UPI000A3E534A|nr:hypothetical protein [Pseudoxanthomonas suwonensis]